jgi:hypothetical protein
MEAKKYLVIIDDSGGSPYVRYCDSVGEIFDIIKEMSEDMDEFSHMLQYSDAQMSELLSLQGYGDIQYRIYEYGEEEPFSILSSESNYTEWLDQMLSIEPSKEQKIMNYIKFNESKRIKFPNIKKVEIDGFVILYGRDANSNDHLTFNMANPDDIWLHCKGVPGTHMIIRISDKLPTKETIKAAAQIVVKNSKTEKGKSYDVLYCKSKFVKKEKGMKPGEVKVNYINSHEVNISN